MEENTKTVFKPSLFSVLRNRAGAFGSLLCVPMFSISCATAGPVPGLPTGISPTHSEPERQIEIAIRDYAYVMLKPEAIRMGTPTVITIRNEDSVTHGFVSSMFVGLSVQGEGGIPVSVNGRAGFHVDPGQTLTVRFTPDRAGTLDFQCDIHPDMKGELLYIDIQPSRHR